jgi:uncharacterized protein (UPF0332 family)
MDVETRVEIKRIAAKGDRSLKAAKKLKQSGDFDFAVSRAYYAMFYYATAVRLTKGLAFSRHRGVVAGFGEHFVKPGVFPKELSKKLHHALERRHISDYEYGDVVTGEVAEQTFKDAEDFIKAVKKHIQKVLKEVKP